MHFIVGASNQGRKGYIAGTTNPYYESRCNWDVFVNINSKKVITGRSKSKSVTAFAFSLLESSTVTRSIMGQLDPDEALRECLQCCPRCQSDEAYLRSVFSVGFSASPTQSDSLLQKTFHLNYLL